MAFTFGRLAASHTVREGRLAGVSQGHVAPGNQGEER